MATITIRRDTSGQAVFDPSTIKLGANDFVIFINEDPQGPHQPTPQGQAANYWFESSLPSYVAGQEAAVTPAINLAGPNPITYVDGIDASMAPGTITF